MLLSTNFTAKAFPLRGFILQPTERHWVPLKTVLGILKIALHLRDRHYFYVTITGNFERFQYFNFETNFLKNKNFF